MKKLITILSFLFCYVFCVGQTYPITQNLGSATTLVNIPANGAIRSNFLPNNFTDTTAANAVNYVKNYPGMIIRTGGQELWIRNSAATGWIQIQQGSDIPPTWQQTLINGSDFTQNNKSNFNGYTFELDSGRLILKPSMLSPPDTALAVVGETGAIFRVNSLNRYTYTENFSSAFGQLDVHPGITTFTNMSVIMSGTNENNYIAGNQHPLILLRLFPAVADSGDLVGTRFTNDTSLAPTLDSSLYRIVEGRYRHWYNNTEETKFYFTGEGHLWMADMPFEASPDTLVGWKNGKLVSTIGGTGGLSGGNLGSGYRLYVPSLSGIKTLTAGTNIVLDSATTNQIGITAKNIYTDDGTITGNDLTDSMRQVTLYPYKLTFARTSTYPSPFGETVNQSNVYINAVDTNASQYLGNPRQTFGVERILRFTSNTTTNFRYGTRLNLQLEAGSDATINTLQGDALQVLMADLRYGKLSGYSGVTTYATSVDQPDWLTSAIIGRVGVRGGTSGSNYSKVNGYTAGFSSMLLVPSQYDSLDKFIGYFTVATSGGASGSKVGRVYDFFGSSNAYTTYLSKGHYGVYIIGTGAGNIDNFFDGVMKIGGYSSGDGAYTQFTNVSASLELGATDKGFLPNRLSASQRGSLTGVASLFVWDTDSLRYMGYNGTSWRGIAWTGEGGGGGTPGGSNTQVQYNNSSSFGGISGFTSDGTNVTAGSGNLRATSPRFTTSINDANGNELINLTATGSAVNEWTLANGSTGVNPNLTASGETNVGLDFTLKGTGFFQIRGNSTQAGTLALYEDTDDGTNYTAFKVGTQSGNITYTLPTADGTSGYVLSTNGSGVLSWIANGSGSGITINSTPISSGTATRILFENSSNQVSEDAGLTYNPSTDILTVGGNMNITPSSDNQNTIRINTSGGNAAIQLGTYPSFSSYSTVYFGNVTPDGTNYNISSNNNDFTLNATANLNFAISSSVSPYAMKIISTGVGVFNNTPTAALDIVKTTEQLRVGYDGSNYYSTTVSSSGLVTYAATGSNDGFTFSDEVGIGTTAAAAYSLTVGGTGFTGGIQIISGSTSPSANATGAVLSLGSTIVEAGSGTHALFAGIYIPSTIVTGGSATVTNTAQIYVGAAMSATVTGTNYAIWVDDGTVQFDAAVILPGIGGAGAVTSDANGNLSVTSDGRLKYIDDNYSVGLKEVLQLNPIVYRWRPESGMETHYQYAGFDAREVYNIMGELAAPTNKNGYHSLQDRAILGAVVNGEKELYLQIQELKKEIENLKKKIK